MRFSVDINDKLWNKVVRRFEARGIIADTDAELFEVIIATAIASENRDTSRLSREESSTSSMNVLILPGKIKVEEEVA